LREAAENIIFNKLTLVAMAPFFPSHFTASGNIEPGSPGHMGPGRATAYPSSPPSHHSCCRALNTVSIDTISFNIVHVPCQVSNKLYEYINFFDILKETFKFWANNCHVKDPLPPPPPHTSYCYEELHAPGQNHGGHDKAGPIFSP
jgi:hypothetical protein